MFCSKCGKSVPDGARFCDGCGAVMSVEQPVQEQPVQQPVYQQPVYQQPVYQQPVYQQPVYQQPIYQQPVYQQQVYQQPASPIRPPVHYSVAPTVLDVDTPCLSALKKLIRSPLVIFTILLMIGQIVVEYLLSNDLANMMYVLFRHAGLTDYEIVVTGSSINFASVAIIVALSICVGCAFAKKGYCTVGLVILKVLTIIAIVCLSITGLLLLSTMALLYVNLGEPLNGIGSILPGGTDIAIIDTEKFQNACLIIIGVTIVVFGLTVLFFARALGMLNAATEIAKTGRTRKKASVYVAIVCILGGILALACAAGMAVYFNSVNELLVEELPILKLISPTLISGVTTLLIGSIIFTYRSTVQPLACEVPVAQPEMVVIPPVFQVPVAETPMVEQPVIEETMIEEPAVEESMYEATMILDSVFETPVIEESVIEEPVIEEPVVEEPVAQEPVVEEPVVEEPVVEEPVVEVPVVEEPVVEVPVVEVPVVEIPQGEFVFCGYCGKKVLSSAKFCPYCGKAK